MQWILLVCAGLLEIGWPLGFKLAGLHQKYFYHFIALSVVSMGLSGFLLYLAQKSIPIGTAYVIWTGIGAVGTVLLGIFFFHGLDEHISSPFRVPDPDGSCRAETSALIK